MLASADLSWRDAVAVPPPTPCVSLEGGLLWDGQDDGPPRPVDALLRAGTVIALEPHGRLVVPPEARRIDASGLTILPGLIDMHVHLTPGNGAQLCLAAGVTTVRDVGNYTQWIVGLRELIRQGRRVGPRIVATGEIIEGPRAFRAGFRRVTTPEEAALTVQMLKDRGVDGIKLYQSLPPSLVVATLAEARRQGLWTSGHLCCGAYLNAMALAGGRNNYSGFEVAAGAVDAALTGGITSLEHSITVESAHAAAAIAASGVALCPTLAVVERFGRVADAVLDDDLDRMSDDPRTVGGGFRYPTETSAASRVWYDGQRNLVRDVALRGGCIVAGTDTPFGVAPGFGLHRELALLVEAGLTPVQALRAATSVAAATLGLADQLGSIAVGRAVDLLLVEGDPLVDLGSLSRLQWVIQGGRVYGSADLRALRDSKTAFREIGGVMRAGRRVAYRVQGEGTPLLVLADGPGVSACELGSRAGSADWFSLATFEHSARVVYVDPAGTGRSSDVPLEHLNLDGMAADVESVRAVVTDAPTALLGCGTGGSLALWYAHRYPHRVSRLILVNTIVSARTLHLTLQRLLAVAPEELRAALEAGATAGVQADGSYHPAYWQAARAILAHSQRPFQPLGGFRLDRPPASVQWATYRALWKRRGEFAIDGQWRDLDLTALLPNLCCPVLVITGTYDQPALEQATLLLAALPDAQHVVFAESGTVPWLEQPDQFLRVVRAFLSSRDRVQALALQPSRAIGPLADLAGEADRHLAAALAPSPMLRRVRMEEAATARFQGRTELRAVTGRYELVLRVTDAGILPEAAEFVTTASDQMGLPTCARELARRLRAWAGELPAQLLDHTDIG